MNLGPKASGTEPAGSAQLHPFEPTPGELGMNLDQLREAGLVEEAETTTQGAYLALLRLMSTLKRRRQAKGLSLADVSERSGLAHQAIGRLEDGTDVNPNLETLFRYALALDAGVTLGVEEMESGQE